MKALSYIGTLLLFVLLTVIMVPLGFVAYLCEVITRDRAKHVADIMLDEDPDFDPRGGIK